MKRLFFTLWPDNDTRQRCQTIINAIDGGFGKPVKPANVHVTLVFLGHIADDKELVLRQAASTVPIPDMTLCFDQLSYWQKSQVLCLTASRLCKDLVSLVDCLSALAQKIDIPLDGRIYRPHVTLIKKAKEPVALEFEPVYWQTKAFCLVESCSSPIGVQYKVIAKWGNE